jgi:preprotein translocase subunit SecG
MQTLLLVGELVIAVALVIFVLLQRSEGGALGMGGGGGGGMGGLFTPRGAADTLTRTTTILGMLFFLACIGLDLLAGRPAQSTDSLLTAPRRPAPTQPLVPAPSGPQVPKPQ